VRSPLSSALGGLRVVSVAERMANLFVL